MPLPCGTFAVGVQDDQLGAFAVNLVVGRPWRGLGVGKAIVRYLMDQAAALGAARLYAEVDPDNMVCCS